MQLDFSLCLPFIRLVDCLDILSPLTPLLSMISLSRGRLYSKTAWISPANNIFNSFTTHIMSRREYALHPYYWQPENKTFALHNVHFNCSKLLPSHCEHQRVHCEPQIFIHNVCVPFGCMKTSHTPNTIPNCDDLLKMAKTTAPTMDARTEKATRASEK